MDVIDANVMASKELVPRTHVGGELHLLGDRAVGAGASADGLLRLILVLVLQLAAVSWGRRGHDDRVVRLRVRDGVAVERLHWVRLGGTWLEGGDAWVELGVAVGHG